MTVSVREAQRQLLLAGKHYVMASSALLNGVVDVVESRVDRLERGWVTGVHDGSLSDSDVEESTSFSPSVPHLGAEFREAPKHQTGTGAVRSRTRARPAKAAAKRTKAPAKRSGAGA